jgi:UDP-2,4-diacetamido-2,4,6-trideoxy-beta-L-altropyranose hydrolase
MKVAIRTDASHRIGSGHLMRCLTLADGLMRTGAEVTLIGRRYPDALEVVIADLGLSCCQLPDSEDIDSDDMRELYRTYDWRTDASDTLNMLPVEYRLDCLIVDHYALDARWEGALRPFVEHIMVIDDLANRPHDANLLLDQNYYEHMDMRYQRLLPEHCRILTGPRYAMLRREFALERYKMHLCDGRVERLLISYGGSDPNNLTTRTLKALPLMDTLPSIIDVVIGAANDHTDEIETLAAEIPGCTVHQATDAMAELMRHADLAVGSAGSTTWERCCLGLPALVIPSAETERHIAHAIELMGVGKIIGYHTDVTPEIIAEQLQSASERPDILVLWSRRAADLVDGKGCDRVCEEIVQHIGAEVGA